MSSALKRLFIRFPIAFRKSTHNTICCPHSSSFPLHWPLHLPGQILSILCPLMAWMMTIIQVNITDEDYFLRLAQVVRVSPGGHYLTLSRGSELSGITTTLQARRTQQRSTSAETSTISRRPCILTDETISSLWKIIVVRKWSYQEAFLLTSSGSGEVTS